MTNGIVIERLALRPKDAAKALGVSQKTLSKWTKENKIPHKRVNGTILYNPKALDRWLEGSFEPIPAGQDDCSGNKNLRNLANSWPTFKPVDTSLT